MSKDVSEIVVLFDQESRDEFFSKLDWEHMVSAWSKAIHWEYVSKSTVRLFLGGIDGLNNVMITRKEMHNKVYIVCTAESGELIQTGAWEYDDVNSLGVCFRRVHKNDIVELLQDRLADFCCSNFMKKAA